MGFFEESFAAAGRTLDALLEGLVDACRQRGESDLIQSVRERWSTLREAFEGEEARQRRIGAYVVVGGVALLIGVMTLRSVTRAGELPPLTEAQQVAKDAAARQMKLQMERDKAFAAVKKKASPRPAGPIQPGTGSVRSPAR